MRPPALPYSADMLFCSMRNSWIASTLGVTDGPPNTVAVTATPSRTLSSVRGRLPLTRTLPSFPQAPSPLPPCPAPDHPVCCDPPRATESTIQLLPPFALLPPP